MWCSWRWTDPVAAAIKGAGEEDVEPAVVAGAAWRVVGAAGHEHGRREATGESADGRRVVPCVPAVAGHGQEPSEVVLAVERAVVAVVHAAHPRHDRTVQGYMFNNALENLEEKKNNSSRKGGCAFDKRMDEKA